MKKLVFILVSLTVVCAEIPFVDITQYENFTVPDLKTICLSYTSSAVNKKCNEQLKIVCQNITLLTTMLDASSKFPYPGLGYASRMDLGNIDQCMTIDHRYNSGRILGEHCTVGLLIPDIFGNVTDPDSYFKLSMCRPDACTADDFNTILTNVTNLTLPLFQDYLCQTIETGREITAADVVTILIFSVSILLMIVSTTYDFYLEKRQLETPNQLYLAFSVISNGRKLLQITKHSKEQIQAFQGIRVFSMMWVVAGHGFGIWSYLTVANAPAVAEWQTKMYAGYITTAPLSVDTFFYISGFLLAYQYLKQKPKPLMEHVKSIPSIYLHRYLRITPALLMVYLITISVVRYFGSPAIWTTQADTCKKYWWPFFLYIQNYYNYEVTDLCLATTWYLSADMQMFLLSPIVIIPVALYLQKSDGFKVSMIQMIILNLLFIALPIITKLIYRDYDNGFDTHSRLTDYFVGMMFGIFMRVKQDKPFLYKTNSRRVSIVNLVTWVLVLLGMLTILICYRHLELHPDYVKQTYFISFARPAWCIGLSWIVYSCHHGYGGIVNWILTRPIFQVWGRLSYCVYLLHLVVIMGYLASVFVRTRLYFSDYTVFYTFCGHYVITLILSVFWTLAFESPLIVIEKVIFGGERKTKRNTNVNKCMEMGIQENTTEKS